MIDTLLRAADPAADLRPDPGSAEARQVLAGVLSTPRHGAGGRRRRTVPRRAAFGLALAGATAAVVLGAPMPWDHNGRPGLGSAAYAVTRDQDGTVHVAIRWSELKDPAGLQRALDKAGARTKVFLGTANGTGTCMSSARTTSYSSQAVQYNIPGGASGQDGILVRPRYFPRDATFVLAVSLAANGDTSMTTFAPGEPPLVGYQSFMVVGKVPACVGPLRSGPNPITSR